MFAISDRLQIIINYSKCFYYILFSVFFYAAIYTQQTGTETNFVKISFMSSPLISIVDDFWYIHLIPEISYTQYCIMFMMKYNVAVGKLYIIYCCDVYSFNAKENIYKDFKNWGG